MQYTICNDEELVSIFNEEKCNEAFVVLVTRYKKMINYCTRKYIIDGYDFEELYQEGIIGLLGATSSFNKEKGSFFTFALCCVKRKLSNYIRNENRKKITSNKYQDSLVNYEELTSRSTEEEYLVREQFDQISSIINNKLSKLEKSMLIGSLSGNSYQNLSRRYKVTSRSVDNALQRAKRKIAYYSKMYK